MYHPSMDMLIHQQQQQSANPNQNCYIMDSSCYLAPGCSSLDYQLLGSVGPNGTTHSVDLPDTKEGIEELCPVCGDKVSGYHYGLLTCESCKGFFKRTVQNKKVYTCVAERQCHIDKSQRKRCPYCRFQKCLDVGMKLEAVRADRMRGGRNKFGPMYKRDRARKLQLQRQRQQIVNQTSRGCHGTPSAAAPDSAHQLLYGTQGYSSQPKHELVQIHQLSSSTSSPESSPSPLGQAVVTLANHGGVVLSDLRAGDKSKAGPSWLASATNNNNNNNTGGYYDTSASTSSGSSNSSSTGPSPAKLPNLIREFQQYAADDREWQTQMFGLLQQQTHNQCVVDSFELMCKVLDQSLFAQVDWARNSIFFKELKVDDQMKLLQHSWSDMLILDHIHQRLHNHLPPEVKLSNGQTFDLSALSVLGFMDQMEALQRLSNRLQDLKFDPIDYTCLKFMLLLNPEIRSLVNRKHVTDSYEQVKQALLDYTAMCYPHIPDKFGKLTELLTDLHTLAVRGEEYLYFKHLNENVNTQTLLMEMLHANRK